jgi:hypothetical protein
MNNDSTVIGKNPEIYELLGSSFTYTYKETVRQLELSSLFTKNEGTTKSNTLIAFECRYQKLNE